jgi:hypothetical protein
MGIAKQEFYEGAALHRLAREGGVREIRYNAPFFAINGHLYLYLKYCTRGRSPWGFTFTPDEQASIRKASVRRETKIGLICGSDGIALLTADSYQEIAFWKQSSVYISCYRKRNQYYEICGPDGVLDRKIAPSEWDRLLAKEEEI